jgi:hypothetical protein
VILKVVVKVSLVARSRRWLLWKATLAEKALDLLGSLVAWTNETGPLSKYFQHQHFLSPIRQPEQEEYRVLNANHTLQNCTKTMRLDAKNLRYLSAEDWRVLTAVTFHDFPLQIHS